MKGSDPRLWFSAFSLALVVTLVVSDLARTTPGPLNPVHRDLDGTSSETCARCHGSEGAAMAEACAECHRGTLLQIQADEGFHGTMQAGGGVAAADCGACHVEHHGDEVALVDAAVFALAGVAELAEYDHAGLDFTLTGTHLTLECAACHAKAESDPLPEGQARFLGLRSECSACHDDPHGGELPDCASCHGQERPLAEVALFEHPREFPLVGEHASAACRDCHAGTAGDALFGLELGRGGAARGCVDCHEDPHGEGLTQVLEDVLGVNVGVSLGAGSTACATCHAATDASFQGAQIDAVLHAALGFPLDAPHDRAACADCHSGFGSEGSTLARPFSSRAPRDCADCHEDPHGSQFAAGAACLDCHAPAHFEPSLFDVERHAATAFPLTGAHADSACSACHEHVHGAEVRLFVGTPSTCAACHEDPHDGQFGSQESCAACHTPHAFSPSSFGPEEHAATAFPLEGPHARANCADCHANAHDGVRRFVGTATECARCHEDVHAGQFGDQGACSRCHGSEAFLPSRFDVLAHGAGAFPLEGAHAAIACGACHEEPVAAGQARVFAGTPTDCAACHADPHGDGFLPEFARAASCQACHGAASFSAILDSAFSHGEATGFELQGAHDLLECAACHAPRARPDELARRMDRARGRSCADCHADPHVGQFAENGVTSCERCHGSSFDFGIPRFDHSDTRFELDSTHADLACSKCHQPWPVAGVGEIVRYKPLGVTCVECHGETGGKR